MEITFTRKGNKKEQTTLDLDDFIDVKGWKALGNKLPFEKIKSARFFQSSEGKSKVEKTKPRVEEKKEAPGTDDTFDVGSTVNFNLEENNDEKDQLDLF